MTQQAFRLNIVRAQVSTEVSAPQARNGVDAHDGPSRFGVYGCTIRDTPCGVVHLFRVVPRPPEQLGRVDFAKCHGFARPQHPGGDRASCPERGFMKQLDSCTVLQVFSFKLQSV
jgi:hypothetical protein